MTRPVSLHLCKLADTEQSLTDFCVLAGAVPILGPAEFGCNMVVRSERAKSVIEAAVQTAEAAVHIEDASAIYEENLVRVGSTLRSYM